MKFLWSVVVVLALAGLAQSEDKCGICMTSNEVLCLNQTSYQLCMNNEPLTRVYHCAQGKVCSESNDICTDETTTNTGVCGSGSGACGQCTTDSKYTCLSSTQFTRCIGGAADPSLIQSCDTDKVCVQALLTLAKTICVPQCVVDSFSSLLEGKICLNEKYDEPSTTTTPPVTPSQDVLKTACTNGRPTTSTATYFFVRNPDDTECTSYVYCETINSEMYAIVMTCKSGQYINIKTGKCQTTKLTNCGV